MLRRILAVLYIAVVVAWPSYFAYLAVSRPIAKSAAAGFIYEMPAHGPPVYITLLDLLVLIGLPALGLSCHLLLQKFEMIRRNGAK
jgi:hypothetical protein